MNIDVALTENRMRMLGTSLAGMCSLSIRYLATAHLLARDKAISAPAALAAMARGLSGLCSMISRQSHPSRPPLWPPCNTSREAEPSRPFNLFDISRLRTSI